MIKAPYERFDLELDDDKHPVWNRLNPVFTIKTSGLPEN